MKGRGISFEERDISTNDVAYQKFVRGNYKTVPQVFKDGIHIGGYEATKEYLGL